MENIICNDIMRNTELNYYNDGTISFSHYGHTILSIKKTTLQISLRNWSKTTISRANYFLPEGYKINKKLDKVILTCPFGKVDFDEFLRVDMKRGKVLEKW